MMAGKPRLPVAVLPGLILVATGVALSFTPAAMVMASSATASHSRFASGLASSATQVGAVLGTATSPRSHCQAPAGSRHAFTAS